MSATYQSSMVVAPEFMQTCLRHASLLISTHSEGHVDCIATVESHRKKRRTVRLSYSQPANYGCESGLLPRCLFRCSSCKPKPAKHCVSSSAPGQTRTRWVDSSSWLWLVTYQMIDNESSPGSWWILLVKWWAVVNQPQLWCGSWFTRSCWVMVRSGLVEHSPLDQPSEKMLDSGEGWIVVEL